MVTGSEVSWIAKAWKTFLAGRYFTHFLREIHINNILLKKKNISAMLQKSGAIHVKALHPKVSTLIRNINNKQVELWFVILRDEGSAPLECTRSKQPKRLLFQLRTELNSIYTIRSSLRVFAYWGSIAKDKKNQNQITVLKTCLSPAHCVLIVPLSAGQRTTSVDSLEWWETHKVTTSQMPSDESS